MTNCDIAIIGAGASGSAAAWNLRKLGLKIICFEQGDIIDKNYNNNRDWENEKIKKFNVNPNVRKSNSDYPIDDENSPISIANFNAVGGSTILYSGHFPRFREVDFKLYSREKIGSDWPFGYHDLKKFYDINDKMMGVHGLSGDPKYPLIKFTKSQIPLGKYGNTIAKGFRKLKWHYWPSYSALKIQGHNFNRVRVDNIYLSKAIKAGVILKKNCRVKKILIDKKKNIRGLIYSSLSNKENFCKAKLIILACNAIGTSRVLLNSYNSQFPNGLGNSTGLVGKNLMLHPLGYVEGISKKFLGSNIGPQGCCLFSHQFSDTKKKNKFKKGYTMQILRSGGPLETSMYLNKLNLLKFGETFHNDFLKFFGKSVQIGIICEDFPVSSNRVILDQKNRDSSGMPGVKIYYKLSQNSKKMMIHGISKAKKLLNSIDAKNTISFGPVKHAGWHLMGTAKMGVNKKSSVTNKNGETHDIKNLFIVDGSVFPSSSSVNSMSTIQAVSLKITEYIKENINFLIYQNE